jgi:predicted Zn finger-like uncharacterized protein
MKIECDKCSAKYSIADEKVRGKTFKIRCKKCSNVIIVRDKGVVSEAGPAAAPETAAPGWHLAINGETVGPIAEDEVRQRYAAGEIDKDTAVWQEGFDDWLPLGEIEAFADLPERGAGAEDPFAASANQDDYAVGAGRSLGVGAAAAVAATGTDGLSEPQSPRVSKLTGQRNENSVLFSLDSLQAMATAGAATAKPNVAAPAARASVNPSKGLATSAPSSEGSGLIDIRSLGSMVGGGGAAAAASAAPQAAADDAALPSFGGGGFGGLASTPLISPIAPTPESVAPPVVVQQRSNAPLYIMMIVLILAVGGLGAYIVMKPPEEAKTIVQEVPVVAPSVKDDDDKKKKDDDDDDKKKKDDEKAAEGDSEGEPSEAGADGDDAKGGVAKKSGSGVKKAGGSGGSTSAGGSGATKAGDAGGGSKSGGGDSGGSAPSVDCILDPSKCGSSKKPSGGSSGGTSGGSTDPNAPEKLSATDIKNAMAEVKDAAKACGPKHGGKPGEKVTVKLSFSGATGTVTKATPQPPHDGTPLGNCVAGALKNAKVIKFKTATQGASYSVTM